MQLMRMNQTLFQKGLQHPHKLSWTQLHSSPLSPLPSRCRRSQVRLLLHRQPQYPEQHRQTNTLLFSVLHSDGDSAPFIFIPPAQLYFRIYVHYPLHRPDTFILASKAA